MRDLRILVIGGGIGGLTAAIALRRAGMDVEVAERDPAWSVYGVGIIQQSNVVRAMAQLDLLDGYMPAGFGFSEVDIFLPDGRHAARVPSPQLVPGYPANVGVGRPALHKVLGERAVGLGARVRLGVTADDLSDDGEGVDATFSDGTHGRFDLVIGADGAYSATRRSVLPGAPEPAFTGQSVWRHNFDRPAEVRSLHSYQGRVGIGLVPLSETRMYMFVTTPEPSNPRFAADALAAAMRDRLAFAPPAVQALAQQITDDVEVVYRPLETVFLTGPWHRGRVVLLGDAVHCTTPHLGQGAGMAIEDSIVLAEELLAHPTPEDAFEAYRARRFERCRRICEMSESICRAQLGTGPRIDYAAVTREMFETVAQPL